MDPSGYNEEAQKAHEAALLDVGNRLANPPSSTNELLSLLTRAEILLSCAHQICTCHKTIWSVQVAIRPAMHALISDKIFKHRSLDVQLAVASCINEIVRITISNYPYTDAQMKEIFVLFMVAIKQLSCGSSKNCERALQILETMAEIKSCLVMLDLDVEMDAMVVEMFQLFLDTIRPHHSTFMFNHMQKIMILIVQEDEISVELLRTLLSSVRLDNKNTSPRSWELGKSVIENCAIVLQQHVREAVKAMSLNVADYAEIVASLCQDTPNGNDTVASKEVATVQAANEEVARVQVANEEIEEAGSPLVANEEVATVNEEVKTVQFVATDASGDWVSKLDERSQAGQETQIQPERRRREIKPNTLMRPEEGYQHAWVGGGSGSSKEDNDSVIKVVECPTSRPARRKQSGLKEKGSKKREKTTESVVVQPNTIGAEKDKVVESSMSKPTKAKQSKAKEIGSNKRKKASKSVVVQSGAQKEKVSHSYAGPERDNENDITSQKHENYEAGNIVDKVVESPIPEKAEYPGELDSETEKEPMDSRREFGQELVNLRIMVWWPLDETYYTGTVESYDPVAKKHKIKYDDDEEEVLDMSEERWEPFNEIQSRQAQSSNEQEACPSPAKEPAKTQKKTTKRKAGSQKKEHAGSSSKRSKREGVNSGHSALESIPVNDESDDDETSEAKFSWKARAMSHAGKQRSNTSRRKGRPSSGTPNDTKNG